MTQKINYTFDQVARSERYFTASLLTHLLMINDFCGMKQLIRYLFEIDDINGNFEIVSELDPLRDGSPYNDVIKQLYKRKGRVAVPDLFIRYGEKIIVIEAKFFTDPNDINLEKQIMLQKQAIELAIDETEYSGYDILHCLLTIKEQQIAIDGLKTLTWDKILELIEQSNENNEKPTDFYYALNTIKGAIERAKEELETSGTRRTVICDRYNSLAELLNALPTLMKEGKVFFGFTGGERELMQTSIESLENRNHYKVSDLPWSKNWLTLDLLIKRIIQTRYIPTDDFDENCEE